VLFETVGGRGDTLRVLKNLLDLLLPTRCAGCGLPGAACCSACDAVWGSLTRVTRGLESPPIYALAPHRGIPRRLLLAYKERGRRDLAPLLGRALAEAIPVIHPGQDAYWLVPAPSRKQAARARGGPHMLRLARHTARALAAAGTPAAVAPALTLASAAQDAVGLDRTQRAANLAGNLEWHAAGAPPPATSVVILDDVVTTGATAAACSRTLSDNGLMVTAVLTLTAAE
jgi:predicted amidophosphoribosyltransferase